MKPISSELEQAQKETGALPSISLKAKQERLNFEKLHGDGAEQYYHAMAAAGSGALVRARITPPGDGGLLYTQHLPEPGPSSDFENWDQTGCYNVVRLSLAADGDRVSLYYILSNRRIERLASQDGGQTWAGPELIDYSPTTAINGIAAGVKPGGDEGIFFADQATLYVKIFTGGQWQTRQEWECEAGLLTGVSVVYHEDWALVVTGESTGGDYRLWRLVYGDGGALAPGEWSALEELADAPQGESYSFCHASLSLSGCWRSFYNQVYGGAGEYNMPYMAKAPGGAFNQSIWQEAEPFGADAPYGLSQAEAGGYLWAASSGGVYRASLHPAEIELEADITRLELNHGGNDSSLVFELDNSGGAYNSIEPALENGSRVSLGLGYITSSGGKTAGEDVFVIQGREYIAGGGRAVVRVVAGGGYNLLGQWRALYQHSWNKYEPEMPVGEILGYLLGRAGISLEIVSSSLAFDEDAPPFMLNPGADGLSGTRRLMGMVADRLYIQGIRARVINPAEHLEGVYDYYGAAAWERGLHCIMDAGYRQGQLRFNHIMVEGREPGTGLPILASAFDWDDIYATGERKQAVAAPEIDTLHKASGRAEMLLSGQGREAVGGWMQAGVNAGLEVGDVVSITHPDAGLCGAKRRVASIKTVYEPARGRYRQVLELEGL